MAASAIRDEWITLADWTASRFPMHDHLSTPQAVWCGVPTVPRDRAEFLHDMEAPKAVTDLVRMISCAYGIATDRSAASACGERTFRRGKGLARDTRVRWALEEVDQPYEVRLVSFRAMKEPAHRALHPFGQIPTYEEGDLRCSRRGRSCSISPGAIQACFWTMPMLERARSHGCLPRSTRWSRRSLNAYARLRRATSPGPRSAFLWSRIASVTG